MISPGEICPDCRERPRRVYLNQYLARCLLCQNAFQNKSRVPPVKIEEKQCELCKRFYLPHVKHQRYCQAPCTARLAAIKESNLRPVKSDKPRKRANNAVVAYFFFKKKFSPGNQYRACRG